jgi:hypothetical protein
LDREPPPSHISVQEAARRLGRSEQNIRDRIKSGTLSGTHDVDGRGRVRYWALEAAVNAESARADEVARVRDVRDELNTVSAAAVAQLMGGIVEELGRQNSEIIPRLADIVAEVHGQREDVTAVLRQQREVLLGVAQTLERMEHRQLQIIEAVGHFRREAEKEGERQEETIDILKRTLELQERAERRRTGVWGRLFTWLRVHV